MQGMNMMMQLNSYLTALKRIKLIKRAKCNVFKTWTFFTLLTRRPTLNLWQ